MMRHLIVFMVFIFLALSNADESSDQEIKEVEDISACIEKNIMIIGKKIKSKKKVKDWAACYRFCLQNSRCKAWSWSKKRSRCYLISKVKRKRSKRKTISGGRSCPEYQSTVLSTEDSSCPPEFNEFTFNNLTSCFMAVKKRLIWPEAVAECKEIGGDNLASIHNEETNTFIRSLLTANAFLGGYLENEVWRWTDGSEWDYERWAAGNPSGGNEDKLIMSVGSWEDSRWNDVTANAEDGGYVCQAEPKAALKSPITSKNYPLNYPNNIDQEWTIQAPDNSIIVFQFEYFNVEFDRKCSFDWVKVVDANGDNLLPKAKICGKSLPEPFESVTSKATITFHADISISSKGFSLGFTFKGPESPETEAECPNDYVFFNHTSKCYKFVDEPLTWDESKEYCNDIEQGVLASVHDNVTNSFLRSLASSNAYLGGYKVDLVSGVWRWTDGSEWDYANWYPGKPGPVDSGEDKLELLVGWGDTFWNDVSNVHPLYHGFICQRETSVIEPETEYSCPPEFNEFTFNNLTSCFKAVKKRLIWPEAVAECKDIGGDNLASIHNEETNTFIRSLLTANAFLGGYLENEVWRWTDGSEWDYERWAAGNPSGGNEDKLIMSVGSWEDSRWNDVTANAEDGGYVCQAEPKAAPEPPCFCGLAKKPTTKIVAGDFAGLNEFPWMTMLVETGQKNVYCGASLLNSRWVLTAAHCIKGRDKSEWQIIVGEHNFDVGDESKSIRFNVEYIEDHPEYVSHEDNNFGYEIYDLSLIKLTQPVDFDAYPHIRPVCLPEGSYESYVGVTGTVAGWGNIAHWTVNNTQSPILKKFDSKVSDCSGSEVTVFCSFNPDQEENVCSGDSGGPFFVANGDGVTPGQNYEQIGVVSQAFSECRDGNVYAKVPLVVDWIKEKLDSSGRSCPRQ